MFKVNNIINFEQVNAHWVKINFSNNAVQNLVISCSGKSENGLKIGEIDLPCLAGTQSNI